MRHVHLSLFALSLAACGIDREPLSPSSSTDSPIALDGGEVQGPASADATPREQGVPESLRCVSAPLDGTSDILRVDLLRDRDQVTASVTRGPQFWSHGGAWFGADGTPWPSAQTRVLQSESESEDGLTLIERTSSGTLTIALTRDGATFSGSFVDAQCYLHEATTLTCWNDSDLFGSAWTGAPGALAAHFDWATGACSDASGNPARNQLPIEIVRETGLAECTDLVGRLNGEDFASPDLVGWNLAGAKLDDAELFFANLTSATLNGAALAGLEFGYAIVSGSFDTATQQPSSGQCSVADSPWGGATLTCQQ